ncbi:hypothetical protein [Caldimonas tepidiphila]|uniref:hypothetical protein n=1 Tax=Caldimonas tepidiphila TaxID=2315841 RepID=UPI0013008CEB|nr:hypothetical protein [Caldimonas tepidiphila]
MPQTELTPKPTPENTPLPGGGSWNWSDTAPHWRPNEPAAEPITAGEPTDSKE